MLFLEQEKEKFMAWCHDISMKELALYFVSALGLLLIVFLYYDTLGITGLFSGTGLEEIWESVSF